MASLVADYGSDSLSDSETSTEENEESRTRNNVSEPSSSRLNEDECPNYFTSYDGDQTPDESPERTDFKDEPNDNNVGKLPKPNFDQNHVMAESVVNSVASVFANPFRAAEEEKTSVLERHVKMTPVGEHQQSINGKQICWNFRKGRCRFGHNCKFAHDSDLATTSKQHLASNTCTPLETDYLQTSDTTNEQTEGTDEVHKKRKKVGVSNTLVPPKRAVKAYRKQQQKEQPWLTPI